MNFLVFYAIKSLCDDRDQQVKHHNIVKGDTEEIQDPYQVEVRITWILFIFVFHAPVLVVEVAEGQHERVEEWLNEVEVFIAFRKAVETTTSLTHCKEALRKNEMKDHVNDKEGAHVHDDSDDKSSQIVRHIENP